MEKVATVEEIFQSLQVVKLSQLQVANGNEISWRENITDKLAKGVFSSFLLSAFFPLFKSPIMDVWFIGWLLTAVLLMIPLINLGLVNYNKDSWYHKLIYSKLPSAKKSQAAIDNYRNIIQKISLSPILSNKENQLILLEHIEQQQSLVRQENLSHYIFYKNYLTESLEKQEYSSVLTSLVSLYPMMGGKVQKGYMERLKEELQPKSFISLVDRL